MASKTSKIFLGLLVAIILVVGGGIFYLGSNLDSIVAQVIQDQGSAATGTAVRVEGVSIKLQDASASISGLSVANPAGFSDNPAIEFGSFSINLDSSTLTSDPIIIESITVNSLKLRVEQDGSNNNLRTIMDALPSSSADDSSQAGSDAPKIIIKRFELNDASADVSIPQLGENRTVDIANIALTNIGQETNGATAAQLAQQILMPVMNAALSSAAVDGVKGKVEDKISEQTNKLKGKLFEKLGR